jgi:hypothetical protein
MGTWGSDAFDSDYASETRDHIAEQLAEHLAYPDREDLGFEKMDVIAAAAAPLNAIAARTSLRLPPAGECGGSASSRSGTPTRPTVIQDGNVSTAPCSRASWACWSRTRRAARPEQTRTRPEQVLADLRRSVDGNRSPAAEEGASIRATLFTSSAVAS